jgi:TIR domain
MLTERKLRVFLCHASQDKPVVRELYQRLLTEGWIDPWLDEEKLLPGQDWGMEIEKAVEAADAVIVCLSNNSVTKDGYVQRELKFALDIALEKPDGTIFVIPLRLEDCQVPRRLKSWHYVNYFPLDRREVSYQRIMQALIIRNKNVEKNKKNTFYRESDPVEKGYAGERSRQETEEKSILFEKNDKGDLNNYAGYLLIDEKEKLNQLLTIKSKKFILEDAYDKNSLQSKLIGSISPWIRVTLSILLILFPSIFAVWFQKNDSSGPSFLTILILGLLIVVSLLSVAFLYRKLIDSKLKDEIDLQEEKIRTLIG